ncbi:serine/threonine-protein kinase [Paucibacter sp. XJ19-41]|uniref:serine/threonine-protein kinase n=1 Tax=Paucibacter sp. XJ19-41 TaxID=2927824 RepID=UPI00234AC55E|nr:serine/threonine-protein kinase [Paucibacter sp. XJ19-41]MDC6167822.1 protein kinase [Paucibacter sp. XJ19-41]
MNPPPRDISKSRWPQLSPLLDELLDMEPAARAARLAALRALEPELAADLEDLLARDAELAGNDFLATPALPPTLTAAPLMAGQAIGAYTLEREIGRGGMGSVWLARRTDGRYEGQVAIKFLSTGVLGHGDAGRFAREGQILARLTHPHIARLIDAGVALEGQQPYLVLEYVDGLTLDRFCASRELDLGQRLRLFLDVLAAVAHAHNRLILHRDLKPSNILVNGTGEVKLLDFGIAKLLNSEAEGDGAGAATELTRQAGRAFTPQYAAPEQVQGGDVTTATDVYALGVLLYQLLGGGHPTNTVPAGPPNNHKNTGTALEQLRTVVEVEPRRLSDAVRAQADPEVKKQARELRGDLDTIVAKALKKAPAERYANAAALADDLKRWLAHEPIAARPDSRSYRLLKFLRRHRLGVAAGSLAGLSLAVGIALALWKGQEAQQQRVQAEGLIEFMLGDLRKKLEPVGRLDVLDAVGDKALDYYARQDLARSDADSLGRRARALHLMGEIAEKRGQMAEAEQRFKQAADSTAELLARDPKNTQRLFDHAQSSYWVGYAAYRQRRLPQAEAGFTRYLALANELLLLEPGKPEWLTEQAYAQQNLGVLRLRSGSVPTALTHFQAVVQIWRSLPPERPALRTDLATSLGWLAEAQERQGLFDASIASQQAKLAALLPPGGQIGSDRKLQLMHAAIEAALGRLHVAAGRSAEALTAAQRAYETYAVLAALDPENLDRLERLSLARLQLAETWLTLGEASPARAELARLSSDLERLRVLHERKPDLQVRLRGRWILASLAAAATAEERQAIHAALAEFLTSKAVAAAKDVPDTDTQWVLAMAALTLGDALMPTRKSEAAAHWQAALTRIAALGDVSEPRMICLHAHTLIRLGRTQEARSLAEKLEASAYRHPLYAELTRRLATQLAAP